MDNQLILKDVKKKFTGYSYYEPSFSYDTEEEKRIEIIKLTYPEEMFSMFEILSTVLSDNVTLDELFFSMELLIKDLENGKCGFRNSSMTKESFEDLNFKLRKRNNFPLILSYIPRFIDDVTYPEFSMEFSKRFGKEILNEYGIEPIGKDYGYIEIEENVIDISNKNKAEVLAGLYNNSHPIAMGMLEYDPTPMTIERAEKILKEEKNIRYLLGRPIHVNLENNIICVGMYNKDNINGLAQRVISNCRNINDIGKDSLKKVKLQEEEKLQKQIQDEIIKKQKHKEMVESTNNNDLNRWKVSPEELQPLRKLIEQSGYDITEDTLMFIKGVENEAYPEEMKIMQDIEDVEELEDVYNYYLLELTIARNNDWYIIYGEDEDSIEIVDIASLPTRDKKASKEIHNYITNVINQKANKNRKNVTLNAKEDTSYRMIQRMVSNGEYEILEDEINTWQDNNEIIMHNLVLKPILQRDRELD